jgi:BirA family biotin operon repressor/biotin-[acetyl-CoA-carboxylase] ligase
LSEARRRAEAGAPNAVWLIARHQSQGRGRRGRAWVSVDGNLMATHLFSSDVPWAQIAQLGFAAGLAIAETFEAFGVAAPVTLKWPNDVLIDAGKAAGILIDSGAMSSNQNWVALSFGVNLAGAPATLDQKATCLRDHLGAASSPSAATFFAGLRPRIESWARGLRDEGFGPLREAWLSRAHGLGEHATINFGSERVEGVLAGLSARGELELDTDAGRRLIAAGDVYFSNSA